MTPNAGTVLLVHLRTELGNVVEADLASAGFRIVRVAGVGRLSETPCSRDLDAIVLAGAPAGALWRLRKHEPSLRRVPVLVVTSSPGKYLPLPWPLGGFVRPDACSSPRDLERRGAAAAAVAALIARGKQAPTTRREILGERLWYVGSILNVIGLGGSIPAALTTVRSGGRGILWCIPFLGMGRALMNAGGRLGLGKGFGLGWGWASLAAAAAALWVLLRLP